MLRVNGIKKKIKFISNSLFKIGIYLFQGLREGQQGSLNNYLKILITQELQNNVVCIIKE